MTEILEEAAKNYAIDNSLIGYELMPYKGFIAGAKWQQERMYSEEEVKKILLKSLAYSHSMGNIGVDIWFEQFKKK